MICGLPDKLKIARIKSHKSQRRVSKETGIAASSISHYESGQHDPPAAILMKLASCYGESVDYLLGLNSEQTVNIDGLTPAQIEAVKIIVESLRNANQ